jgi:hypothetical protein
MEWVKIKYKDYIGYVKKDWLEIKDSQVKLKYNVFLREEPSMDSKVITAIYSGSLVEIYEEQKKMTKDQQIAYDILVNIFKKKPEEARQIIEKYSGLITGISKISRPYAEKMMEKLIMGKVDEAKAIYEQAPKSSEIPNWVWIGGGILLGVMFLGFVFRMMTEREK